MVGPGAFEQVVGVGKEWRVAAVFEVIGMMWVAEVVAEWGCAAFVEAEEEECGVEWEEEGYDVEGEQGEDEGKGGCDVEEGDNEEDDDQGRRGGN